MNLRQEVTGRNAIFYPFYLFDPKPNSEFRDAPNGGFTLFHELAMIL